MRASAVVRPGGFAVYMARTQQVTPSALGKTDPGEVLGTEAGSRDFGAAVVVLPPGLLARYRAEELLGAGAMGVVWRATHLKLDRPVAIKLPTVTDPKQVERFVREGRLLSRLEHPNLVRVYDAGEVNGYPYLVMEFVSGCTLATLTVSRALAPELAVALIVQLLDGLAHAHGAGVLHRDVKSENALVTDEGIVKIADFGLARSEFDARKTQVGAIMGTPAYMSPEQARGLIVDARSDLYSVAVVLFELLTGRRPFLSENPMDLLAMQIRDVPPSLAQLVPSAPKELAAAVARGLAKAPEERFATAQEFAGCLRQAIDEQRLERATTRLPALIAGAGTGARVVAGTTFLRAPSPSPKLGKTISAATVARRTESGRLESARTVPAAHRIQLTGTVEQGRSDGSPRRGRRLATGLSIVLLTSAVVGAAWWNLRQSQHRPPLPSKATAPIPVSDVPTQTERPATLAALRPKGAIRITSRPSGARILGQDGSDTHQVTPAVVGDLTPGMWRFTLDLPKYLPAPVSARVKAGVTNAVEVALSPALVLLRVNPSGCEEYRNVKDDMILIAIPGGRFKMGADDLDPNERPVHEVTLSSYYIGKYEVTWKQYRVFCKQTGHPLPAISLLGLTNEAENLPAKYISWTDATAYCGWAGLKLPSEAQWEYAARGKEGGKFPWGDEARDAKGVYRANAYGAADGFEEAAPVGSFGPDAKPPQADGSSLFGVLDMAGNVWEWCQDWKSDYPAGAVMDPHGPGRGSKRVLRGGSHGNDAKYLRAAYRFDGNPGDAGSSHGFRCAR